MAIEHPDHQDVNLGLGELPLQTREGRRELYESEPEPGGPPGIIEQIPGVFRVAPPVPPLMPRPRDVRGQNIALLDAARAPSRAPSGDYLIQSTYDALPINGANFQFHEVVALDPNGDVGSPVTSATISFVIPDGRVGVIRSMKWTSNQVLALPGDPEPGDTLVDFIPVSVALKVSGFVQTSYEQIFEQQGERAVYAIAFEKESFDFTVRFNSLFGGSTVGYQPSFFCTLQGQILMTRGREKVYETANTYGPGGLLK